MKQKNTYKKIFISGLFHETNTFVEKPTCLHDFQVRQGNELFGCLGDESPMDGFLQAAVDHEWEVVPGVDWRATPSGPVDNGIFEEFWNGFRPRFEAALVSGLDAIFLVLHGAMATTRFPDALVPYRKNPHTDAKEAAVRAAGILNTLLAAKNRGVMAYAHSRIMLAPPDTGTNADPMKSLLEIAGRAQRELGFLEVGIAAGFAHADTPDSGLSFWVLDTKPNPAAELVLKTLCDEAWRLCVGLAPREIAIDEAIDAAIAAGRFPAMLVETADNIGGGAPGDGTTILRHLIQRNEGPSCVVINDPESVVRLQNLETGQATLSLGGKGFSGDPGPLEISVELLGLSNGRFELEDVHSHLASMCGTRIDMGPSAVVRHGQVTILITSRATPPFDLGQLRSQGIEPKDFHFIGVKAAVGHKQAYDPITATSFCVSTPGPCSSDLPSLPYRYIRRPIRPLDKS